MKKTDLEYACYDGVWYRFFPNTPEGEAAFDVMAKADQDGVVAFLRTQLPSVLTQLKAAGLTVRKARKQKPLTSKELDALAAELDD